MSKELIQNLRKAPGCCIPHTFFGLPEYSNWREEQMSSKEAVCIGNWSFVIKAVIKGPGALELLKGFSVNSLEKFDVGQGKHLINCNEDGKVISQGMVLRLGEEEFYMNGLPCFWIGYQISLGKHKNVTFKIEDKGDTSFYQVAGPNSIYLLEEVAKESLRDIKFLRFRNIKIGGRDVRAINGLTMAGEIGFELQFPTAYYRDVYDTIIEAGQKYGIRELGYRSHNINHLEACVPTTSLHYLPAVFGDDMAGFRRYMSTYAIAGNWMKQFKINGSFEGNEASDYYRSPVEMGWIRNIKFDHEFVGRNALEAEVAKPTRTVVTLEFNGEDVIDVYASYFTQGEPYEFMDIPQQYQQHTRTDAVSKDGKVIGVSTGPGYSFYFRKMLSLAYLDINYTKPGTNVEILWGDPGTRQKAIRATVAPAPYKKDKRKTDLTALPEKLVLSNSSYAVSG